MSDTEEGPITHVGVVTMFDPKKRFGFLRCSEFDDELFFHFSDGEHVMLGDDGEPMACCERTPETDPEPGTRIYFQTAPGKNGKSKAAPWCFADQYDQAVRRAERRKKAA